VRGRVRDLAARLEAPGTRPVAVTAIVLALLLATAASFAIAQRLKLERSPVAAPRITRLIGPTCGCESAVALLSVRLREPALVNATIVDGSGEHVRSLATELRRPPGRLALEWDGRDDAGEVVRNGRYRLRLELVDLNRTITVPTPVRVDARPPLVRLVEASPLVISPDGDGRHDRVLYRYRTNEPASPLLELGGDVLVRGVLGSAGPAQVRWPGQVDGRPAKPGTYATRVVVEDAAGNRSEPTRVVAVRVRYIELQDVQARVRIGGTLAFRTDADAERVEYSARPVRAGEGFGGSVEPGRAVVRVPRGLRRGRYVFEVTVLGRSERAVIVLVRRRP
jgi:flagellar hook assembly protein FlgD